MIKNLEVGRLSCTTQVSTKCNDKHPSKREREASCTQAHRRQHGDRVRARTDTATSPAALRMPGSHQTWMQQESHTEPLEAVLSC